MTKSLGLRLILSLIIFVSLDVSAAPLAIQRVTENVYALVGDLDNRTAENLGNNATFGFVVTRKGVVLIDSGGTYKGAQQIHNMIKTVTDRPIVTVINSGGQDHRWLGNGYFKENGAEIIAHKNAVTDQKARLKDQFFMLGNLVGVEGLEGTDAVYADTTFDKDYKFFSGQTNIEIYHSGQAHTSGDSYIWLPKEKVMFAGDIVFTERILGVLDHSNSRSWIEVFQALSEFDIKHLVPGHGHSTTLDRAKADTYQYLVNLRKAVADFMDDGGDLSEISQVDQSEFQYLHSFDLLAGRNAQQVFTEMEWE